MQSLKASARIVEFFKKGTKSSMHRKNNDRVFIFGAGVSNAVAIAPVMKELFSKMRERYEYEKRRTDLPEGNTRKEKVKKQNRPLSHFSNNRRKGIIY